MKRTMLRSRCLTALLSLWVFGGCITEEDLLAGQRQALNEPTSGPIFLTGHDPDFHAQGEAGAKRLLTKAVLYVRHDSSLPMLWVESRIATPSGHRIGKLGLNAINLVEGRDYVHMNGAELRAQSSTWWSTLSSRYSAIGVASDFGGLLTQAELDQLNTHRSDITRFVNSGGGLLALSESGQGAGLTSRDRFRFLPIDVSSTGNASPPYTVSTYGRSEFGLIDNDVNSPSHSHFNSDFGLNVVSSSVTTRQIMSLAGKVRITSGGFLVANAGPDQTLDATAPLTPVSLDGSASSTDPGAAPLRYIWREEDTVLANTLSATVTVGLSPGIHTLTLTVTNTRSEAASDTVVITLRDTLPPSITCPASVVVATEPDVCSAHASFPSPSVSGPDIVSVSCSQASGSVFLGGTTPVTCTAVNARGLSASCSFNVMVRDLQPPTLVPPPPTTASADAATCRSAVPDALAGAWAWDNCTHDHDLVFSQQPGAGTLVGLGTTVISLRVTDEAGNSTTATTSHTVIDTTPPTLTRATPDPAVLWPPNHKMVPVTLEEDVFDACDSEVQCRISTVTSNESVNGPGDGNTVPDWEPTGPLTVDLRAERAGPLTGRTYNLGVLCTDDSGNPASSTATVTVPHDQRGR